eukprot:1824622-Lingulodinium_polyedra.AAC.1
MPELPDLGPADVGVAAAGDDIQGDTNAVSGELRGLEAVLVVGDSAAPTEEVENGNPGICAAWAGRGG